MHIHHWQVRHLLSFWSNGRAVLFCLPCVLGCRKSLKGKVSGKKSAEIQTIIEDEAAELGLTTRTDSD